MMSWDVFWFVVGFFLFAFTLLWAGQFAWFVFWVGIGLWLALVEWWLEFKGGRTLSERYGELLERKPIKAYVILAVFWLFVLALTVHLLCMGR